LPYQRHKNFSKIPSDGLGPGPGEVGQSSLKSSTYDVTHKKSTPSNQKNFFFIANDKSLLRLWTALYWFRRQSYARAKPCAIRLF